VALSRASHVVIGGGVQGLSAAWRLAERGADVLVLEKDRVGSGASGIAGGIVRNYYRSAGITEIIVRSVEMFEADPDAYGFRQIGYVACVPERQAGDLVAIREHHERASYDSELVQGPDACREFLAFSWPDWEGDVAALLHERRGGWADAMQTVRHLAARARDAGARIEEGVEVTGLELGPEGVEAVQSSAGRLGCETLVAAPGPWATRLWEMLGREPVIEVAKNGNVDRRPLVSFL
jgi:glycine/D-amino acid oxidase-like deaminating enzyme